MVQRYCIEAFDRTLRDVMHSNKVFGGKCILMGGDLRQILPVIHKGTRATIIDSCINSSHLWSQCTIFHLTINMRLTTSQSNVDKEKIGMFSRWLLSIGDGCGETGFSGQHTISIPADLLVPTSDNPIHSVVEVIYDDLANNLMSNVYFNERVILAPTLEIVNKINEHVISLLLGDAVTYHSADSICRTTDDNDSFDELYTT